MERPAVPLFAPAIRPAKPTLGLGRAQGSLIPSTSGESTSEAAARTQSSADSRETKVRGSLRGRRDEKILMTRPANVATKIGTTGKKVSLITNYFPLARNPKWTIHQYRVDFKPDVESLGVRKALVRNALERKGFMFEGTIMFSVFRLDDSAETTNITYEDRVITFKYVKEISMLDSASLQVLNILQRHAMAGLNMQLVGRNFFDPDAKVSVRMCQIFRVLAKIR